MAYSPARPVPAPHRKDYPRMARTGLFGAGERLAPAAFPERVPDVAELLG